MKILLADDDQVSLAMMSRMLLSSGYDVATVDNGKEAVARILEEDGPRLMILDWMMPGLDGPEVCRAVREGAKSSYVYIILLTARYSKDDLVMGLKAGADDYLIKPCHSAELRARLQTGRRILQLEDSLVSAREEMRFRATHDALTLIQNRGAIVQTLSSALEQVRPSGEHLSVMLCDIDHFKSVNDTHGHPVGDEVLREVARRLQGALRRHDSVGRFGGEEFLCVLRDCGADTLSSRATEICESIRSRPVNTAAGPVSVSMSVGALSATTRGLIAESAHLLQRADAALYRAKREGRNRAVIEGFTPALLTNPGQRRALLHA